MVVYYSTEHVSIHLETSSGMLYPTAPDTLYCTWWCKACMQLPCHGNPFQEDPYTLFWGKSEDHIKRLYYLYIANAHILYLCHFHSDTVHRESIPSTLRVYIFCYDTVLFQNEVNSTHNARYWQCEKVSPIGTEQCLMSSKHDIWHSHQIVKFL